MQKRAQLKFGEAIGVIIIVYLVIMAGFIWYNNGAQKRIAELQEDSESSLAFEKYLFIANLDLLRSGRSGIVDEEFDLNSLKALDSFSQTEEGKEYFQRRLGDASIKMELYTLDNLETPFEVIDVYEKRSLNRELVGLLPFRNVVSVKDKQNDKVHLGLITVQVPQYG
jgi:hypothetical protein